MVNYTAIDEKVMGKFKEFETRMKESLTRYEKTLNEIRVQMEEELKQKIDLPKKSSCDTLCDGIKHGNRTNQPVGFATVGTVGVICLSFFTCGFEVYCDCSTGTGGAWTVFQRRMDGSVDFFRNWVDYVHGFGGKTGEFWLGLDVISKLTSNSNEYELRIDLESWEDEKAYAQYNTFSVGDASTNYTLTVGGYSGDAGDSLSGAHSHNGMQFSSKNYDNDRNSANCVATYKGAWWSHNCMHSHLNGKYYQAGKLPPTWHGVLWYNWKGHTYSLKSSEMKLRRKTN